jgi:hypothetical protein
MGRARRAALAASGSYPPPARRGPDRVWTQERLYEELERFTAGREAWPTQAEFVAAGRSDLSQAVTRYGGAAFWAEALGLTLSDRQVHQPYTAEDAVREARAVIEQLGHLPGSTKLRQLDHPRLATFVYKNGGSSGFRERFGV